MKHFFLLFFLLVLSPAAYAGTAFIPNPYQNDFNAAYAAYPDIPRGVLEAVSYTNTRFTHLAGEEDFSCTGMPQSLTVMGLMEDGQGWFRNNLATVASLAQTDAALLKADARTCIFAYAKAFDALYQLFGQQKARSRFLPAMSPVRRTRAALVALSELPAQSNQRSDFAVNAFVYSVLQFMNDEALAATYGFPQHDWNLQELFGAENYAVLSSRSVTIGLNGVRGDNGAVYRSSGDDATVFSADYGPALWNPAASCNYSSRNSTIVSAVTIHTVQGTYAGCISWFQNCNAGVSAHYVVRSSDGQITQMVYESLKAWHVGSENPYTIGIEHEGYVNNAAWYTNAMYAGSAALCADICTDYNINPLRTGWWPWLATTYYNQSSIPGACSRVKGHQHYANQTHNDPGVNWDWNYFYRLINPAPAATTYITATGNFYDSGGPAAAYSNDERLIWTIAPTNATSVTVSFNSFNVENTWDYLYVYDGANLNAPLIGYYTGTNNPGTITSSGGSLTFEWRSDCATTASGWNATWTSTINASQADNTAPTTQVAVNGTWQTQDFAASFSEADNPGGSGLEKSYYQVIDYDGSGWRANNTQGFFSDDFDQPAIHPEWTTVTGTWAISNGVLEQNNENLSNTNIYAPLTQNLSNRYLYHWAGKIDGSGSNRRAGFHFFCDNPNATNRGNSYFVWFRVDQNVCEWYEVINDTFHLEHSVPMTVNANQWYDWKVIYDRITGKITVYQDNVRIGSWTDATPLTNGSYVSFRSGNANWQVNNFKVYRSRADNTPATVTVGNCPSCMLRYQNANPSTPAGRIKSIVADSAGNLSAIASVDINVDWTAPSAIAIVNDGPGTDIDLSANTVQLQGNWSVSTDTNSGLSRYWLAIGTNACDSDVVAWTNNWGADTATVNNLSLATGTWYYFSVKAENGAGLLTSCFASDGVLIDLSLGLYSTASGTLSASVGPNPFAETATISYTLQQASAVRVFIFDGNGKRTELSSKNEAAGTHRVDLSSDALNLPAGMYFVSIQTEQETLTLPVIHTSTQ